MKYSAERLLKLREAYGRGESLTSLLKVDGTLDSEAIELIYDLQAGTYNSYAKANPNQTASFVTELASILTGYIKPNSSLLDVGTGEGTNLVPLIEELNLSLEVFAIDISWSRLSHAVALSSKTTPRIRFAVADISSIPMADRQVDYVLTVHALEPNGGKEIALLSELARIARQYVILVEPDFDDASPEQKARMIELSYIGTLSNAIAMSGLRLVAKIPILNNGNNLNKASVFVLEVVDSMVEVAGEIGWVDPIFGEKLSEFEGGLRNEKGLWFPQLRGIPFLRSKDMKLTLSPAP